MNCTNYVTHRVLNTEKHLQFLDLIFEHGRGFKWTSHLFFESIESFFSDL